MIFISFSYSVHAAYILRHTTTDNGGVLFTGNTLGLSKAAGKNQPGNQDSIGAFITTDLSQQVGSYLPGTTLAWQENNSTAFLDLPNNSAVLYAELIWSGSFGFNNQITGSVIDTPVRLMTPQNQLFIVTPDPATSQRALTPGFANAGNYTRSADVTSIIKTAGAGMYTVGGVPATISASDDVHNAAGWTLAVIFQNGAMVTSNLSLFVGAEQASSIGSPPATVSGFCVPNSGVLQGSLFISAIEGDSNKGGDRMLFGSNLPLTTAANSLSGPNNPVNNFFASQINTFLLFNSTQFVGSGQLDTRGSFGSYNTNATTGLILPGSRQGYDITSVDISDKLVYGETTAYAQGTTTGDDYMINALALQIQVGAPTISLDKEVNGGTVSRNLIGDIVTFSFTVRNIGTEDALSSTFVDTLEPGLNFVPGSLTVNEIPVAGDPTLGVPLGTILIDQSFTIAFDVRISSLPAIGNVFFNNAAVNYSFQPCGQPLQGFTSISNDVSIELPDVGSPHVTADKTANSMAAVEASVGNTIIFSTNITNQGQADAIDVVFADTLQLGLVLVPGSVSVNGVIVSPEPNLNEGFSIGSLAIGETAVVSFRAYVASASSDGLFSNNATVTYRYLNIADPDPLVPETLTPDITDPIEVNLAVPPRGFKGKFKKCEYLNYNRYSVQSSWIFAFSTDVLAYEIYLGDVLIKTVPSTVQSVKISHLKKKKDVYNLKIRALYANNVRSEPVKIKVKKSHD